MSIDERDRAELHAALRDRRTVPPLIARVRALAIEDADAISLDARARRRQSRPEVRGNTNGVTAKAMSLRWC